MIILVGILVYFGLAVLVGRFLALSTADEIHCPAPQSAAALYSPAETINIGHSERPAAEKNAAGTREREKIHS